MYFALTTVTIFPRGNHYPNLCDNYCLPTLSNLTTYPWVLKQHCLILPILDFSPSKIIHMYSFLFTLAHYYLLNLYMSLHVALAVVYITV